MKRLQNGSRSISQDIFGGKKGKDLNCDLIFTHNDYIAKEYQKIINTNTITFGSYLNNVNPKINTKKKNIVFISQFSEKKDFEGTLLPARISVIPINKPGYKTIVEYTSLNFDPPDVKKNMFTRRNLTSRF